MMKKIISIVILVLMLCGATINVSAVKVDIPFDYNLSRVRIYARAENGNVSVEVGNGGVIKTTNLINGEENIIKHICYEDIYWVNYINNQFIAFSSNYMMTSSDGYNWNVVEDRRNRNEEGTTMHEAYGVDWDAPSSGNAHLYAFDNIPEFEVIDSSYRREDGLSVYVKIVYTGQEWFKFEDTVFNRVADNYDDNGVIRSAGDFDRAIYKSSDRQNWEYIDTRESNVRKFEAGETNEIIPFPGFRHDANIQILNTGKEYLVRSTEYDNSEDTYGYSWPILVFDYNLSYVKTVKPYGNIVDMSYIDNTYYLTNNENKTYKSTDLENWELVGEDLGCPMKNSLSTIYKTRIDLKDDSDLHSRYYEGAITTKNNLPDKNVVTEGIMPFGTRQFGDFYVSFDKKRDSIDEYIDSSQVKGLDGGALDIYRDSPVYNQQSIYFSKDGIYWAAMEIPYPWYIDHIDMTREGIVIECFDSNATRLISVKFSDMEQAVPVCDTKVELNNRVLGFDQPPVTENDRTLVPMRFLFEQMGAEVVWDDATQTATATVPATTEEEIQTFGLAEEKSVAFSVDNTTATVNGSAATMDVPARLINDKTMVPLRFLSENLGFNVSWDEATRTAIVTTE